MGKYLIRRDLNGAYSNQFITKDLAQSFGMGKIIAKKRFFKHKF
ncbi:hypothetical protein VC0101557_06910 [Vibrio cholerae VC0101557]|nr:hypothetical protein VCD_001344 [Vibrio cholerae MJ-1236]EEO11639.1 hypothetical protein VCC_000257 [Vibrio cholerae RC9]EEO18549.1 hypothetical protein VCE_000697 [Vibrio cholerae B33]EEO20950.1 hypothetical protein VCF_002150 [Vibrio cholerae BX 330286]EET93736.1 hypothetical protein VCH_000384 [Vibrio cholerae CIRS101]EEY42252.1 hypothetical protein VIJ_001196 [Vibrio cholerae RC27]EEY47003.1 hypothetical protein VIG_003144 [Vibrio cholerae INDRE 91/1]EGS53400.1 hypothetical protein VC